MSIDPKKGGQCWSCKYCEDVATQTDNPSGSYYRKCTKSGHEYIDTCRFYCSDYIWDGVTEQYHKSSSSSSSSSSYSRSSSTPPPSSSKASPSTSYTPTSTSYSSGPKKSGWLPWVLLILLLLAYVGYYVVQIAPNMKQPTSSNHSSTLTTTPDYPVAYVNISGTLNLRIGPGQAYDIITAMPNGAKVYVLETKSNWSYVIYENQKGWCSAQYLLSEK